jgi:hypothetical protein
LATWVTYQTLYLPAVNALSHLRFCLRFIPHKNEAETTTAPATSRKKIAVRRSKDGKWRSFPRALHLPQYVSSDICFARIKIRNRVFRSGPETLFPLKTDISHFLSL